MARMRTRAPSGRRSLVLTLSDTEMQVLERLASRRALTKSALLRQALRLYESVDDGLAKGEKLYLEDAKKKKKLELMLL